MLRRRVILVAIVCALPLVCAHPALAEMQWPTWLGGKPAKVSNTHSKSHKVTKPTNTSSKGGGGNFMTNSKNLFTPKSKSKVISKWPSDKTSNRKKAKPAEKESWASSLFKPKEPEPPQTIDAWMGLKQIKP